MTKKSPEQLRSFLDVLQGTTSWAKTSRIVKQDESLIFKWLAQSKKDAEHPEARSDFLIEYRGEVKFFHQHCKAAITASIEEIESAARHRARYGTEIFTMFQGRKVPSLDYEKVGVDPDTLELLYGYRDEYLRDANGDIQYEKVWKEPSTDLVQLILQSNSKKYQRKSTVSMDIDHRMTGGVQVAHSIGSMPRKQLEQQATLPVLEIVEPVAEIVAEQLDPPLVESVEPEPVEVEPDEVEEAAPTPSPSLAKRVPLSDLERDLLARAREKGIA
jgi:hypothetical protein